MHHAKQLLIPSRHLFGGSDIPFYRYQSFTRRVVGMNQGSPSFVMPRLNTYLFLLCA